MNKRIMTNGSSLEYDYLSLIICGALFICGCIAGTVSAGLAADNSAITEYLTKYITPPGDLPQSSFFPALLNEAKYHLAAVFFGFSILGVLCVPALSAIRGFFLCFSVSAIVRHFGADGIPLALSIFGLSTLLTTPCFFVLSIQSLRASMFLLRSVTQLGSRGVPPYSSVFFRRLCICGIVLTCSAVIDTAFVPKLISYAAERII